MGRQLRSGISAITFPHMSRYLILLRIIDSGVCGEDLRKKTLRVLRKTCGAKRVLPRSHYFPGGLYKTSNRPTNATGGTADVWRVEDEQKRVYAAKVFRVYHGEEYKIKARRYFVKFKPSIHFPSRDTSRS